MHSMQMKKLLNHPVVIEVLNLVHEGKYSVDSSPIHLSQTWSIFLTSNAFEKKCINERIMNNIKTIGGKPEPKQTSLQFSIWKNSIE